MKRRGTFGALAALLLLLTYGASRLDDLGGLWPTGSPAVARDEAHAEIAAAFAERRSGVWVEGTGVVERLLPDDLRGSRHQRFILELPHGQTLLVSHNIDLAPRLPLAAGDEVSFRGEYEWNERGGLVHWTHHDPRGRRAGGWLRHCGELYR